MPGGDGTGPMGYGVMTGRAGRFCSDRGMTGFANNSTGRGGYGYGRNCPAWRQDFGRRGWRNMAPPAGGTNRLLLSGSGRSASPDPATEKSILKNQAAVLQQELEQINVRLQALESE
ncbi:DUF5320 domain-containing protein [Desulforhopalus singaporensis]|uniref:DUF5320 domain-containing protein n=1 Tax=Desulforhopalus singaporensis TaxID=91360 RepID=A0A1H0UF73_9BACT|nr:DUF5320 domain-containing protein [Desulforhopalus singaporensis]SDP64648.1 hypothetical protein SAMN05660330_03520 [Desulforhopalus singaporensis]